MQQDILQKITHPLRSHPTGSPKSGACGDTLTGCKSCCLIQSFNSHVIWFWLGRFCGVAVFAFLLFPILAIIPLAFNEGSIIAYPLQGISGKWFASIFATARWPHALWNSTLVACGTVAIALPLGTSAALGFHRLNFPGKTLLAAIFVSPMIVPVIITAIGIYFFFAPLGLANNLMGLILAHSAIAVPFVFITVSASVSQIDPQIQFAASSLGSPPLFTFWHVTLPLIRSGILSGGIFAFATSFDEIVIAMMITGPVQRTLPRELLSGVRENLDPTMLAVASIIIAISATLLLLTAFIKQTEE